ncbi:MAG: Hsp20 family protein [Candidatus Woesebacteria bacterium]|jgi:HSP20 family protein
MTRLTRYDPFKTLFSMPRWFEDFDEISTQRGLKIRETDKDIVVEAVVAGVPTDDVDVDIEDGVIKIKAESKEEKKKKDEYKSSSYQYYYTCALSGGQWDKAKAEVVNGVLNLTIPKAEAAKKRKIKVKAKEK